jgi:hypothetical protein
VRRLRALLEGGECLGDALGPAGRWAVLLGEEALESSVGFFRSGKETYLELGVVFVAPSCSRDLLIW